MRLLYQSLGAEIVFVHVGHGLLGVLVVAILAANLPWWFSLGITPLIAFSVFAWFAEARLVMPVARRYLSGDPFPGGIGSPTHAPVRLKSLTPGGGGRKR